MKIAKAKLAPLPKQSSHFPKFGQGTNHPIVDHTQFTDARPTLGSPSATFNPGQSASILPKGPPKFVGVKGQKGNVAQGVTNKRYQFE
jgi:hypothetical protein